MDRIEKFLRKLDPERFAKVRAVQLAIERNDIKGLDVKPYRGQKGMFRCRTGDIRILFVRTGTGENVIVDIDFRGNIYKKR